MKLEDLIAALDLPQSCRVDQRVPKKLLIENTSLTSKDKRQINGSVEGIQWLAALKPNSIGIAEYRDDIREYLEIAILVVTLRESNGKTFNIGRLTELLHRTIPYPLFLLVQLEQKIMLSLGHKRMARNEVGKVILDGEIVAITLDEVGSTIPIEIAFYHALGLRQQLQSNLFTLYEGWIDILYSALAAQITGTFRVPRDPQTAGIRRLALVEFQELKNESSRLRARCMKEEQLASKVDLNNALQLVESKMSSARSRL